MVYDNVTKIKIEKFAKHFKIKKEHKNLNVEAKKDVLFHFYTYQGLNERNFDNLFCTDFTIHRAKLLPESTSKSINLQKSCLIKIIWWLKNYFHDKSKTIFIKISSRKITVLWN